MDHWEITTMKACERCGFEVGALRHGICRGCTVRGLTEAQASVLRLVRIHQPTTLHEIADEAGFASTSTALHHLKTLRGLGLVDWTPHQQRTIHETRWERDVDA
jgi:hypothetical protein